MRIQPKKRAYATTYQSQNQLVIEGFESPFDQKLRSDNRWVVLAKLIPWDEIVSIYLKHVPPASTGRPSLSPRIVIGSLIIKHLCNLDDRETVDQISENMYMQYFLGFTSFSNEPPFDPSLFVEFRKRIGMDQVNAINEKIAKLKADFESIKNVQNKIDHSDNQSFDDDQDETNSDPSKDEDENSSINKGRVIMDATACPQDIAPPTDLNLLNDGREKLEELIDILYLQKLHQKKPRTYRKKARKLYLKVAQMKKKGVKDIRKANGQQLRFIKRDIRIINSLIDIYEQYNLPFPLSFKELRYFWIVQTLYMQQQTMYDNRTRSVEHRIVSIHQPHVRPIVRGKAKAHTEFGAKINLSLIDGISFLDELSWDAFNEGDHLIQYVEKYKERFGFYPAEILADKIYCSRNNRKLLKELNIKLIAKPLGRPTSDPALSIHVSPGERNPIEGKFGQGKTGYGLDRIKARLKNTSESWIALIILVLNLVKLAGVAAPSFLLTYLKNWFTFSAQYLLHGKINSNELNYYFTKQNIIPILYSNQVMI
jgi:IS5 family transposase